MKRPTHNSTAALCSLLMGLSGASCALGQGSGRGVVSSKPEVAQQHRTERGSEGDGSGGGGDYASDARGSSKDSGRLTDEFRYYFSVTTDFRERRNGRNWSDQLVFDEDVMSRDFAIVYQHLLGNYPKPGPHIVARDPDYMRVHLAKVEEDLPFHIPDPEFSGVAILDFEVFRAIWDRTPNRPSDEGPEAHDYDFQDDWRDYIRSVNPDFDRMSEAEQEQYLRETYEAEIRDFFLATLAKCRELRPNAQWGFYGYPLRFYKWRREAPTNVISYGDGSHNGSRLNDRLQWMWDAVDVVSPSIYAPRVIVGPGEDICQDQYTADEDWEFMQNMIREARRVAGGKPVLPFIWIHYNTPRDCMAGQEVRDENLFSQVFGPARHGADGAILWGDINNRHEMELWQRRIDQRFMPLMTSAVNERRGGDGGGSSNAPDDAGGDLAEGQDRPVHEGPATRAGVNTVRAVGAKPAINVSGAEARAALRRAGQAAKLPAKTPVRRAED